MRHRAAWALALVPLLLSACIGGADDGQAQPTTTVERRLVRPGGLVRVAAEQEPVGFNINTAKDNLFWLQQIVSSVYPSVFRTGPDFEVRLDRDLMAGAEVVDDDPLTVEYRIRPQAVWSDGTPISGADFRLLWQSCNGRTAGTDCASTAGYELIEDLEVSDDGKTVTAVFSRPFADWRSLFSNLLPAHHVRDRPGGWNTGLDTFPTVSGGPFVIQSHNKGVDLTLARNDRYWGRKATLDSVVFRFLAEVGGHPGALRRGEVDVIYPQPQVGVVLEARRIVGVDVGVRYGLQFEHLTFNLRHPLLADPRVRRAIALAVDRTDLIERTVGKFDPGARPVDNRVWLDGQPQHEPHGDDLGDDGADPEDPAEDAVEALEDAGFERGPDGVHVRRGQRLALRLSTTSGNALREHQVAVLREHLQEAGIDVTVENASPRELFGKRLPAGDFDLATFAWVATPHAAGAARAVYSAGSPLNYGRYRNAKVEELLARAAVELDAERYGELTNEADEVMWEDMPNLPLYRKPTVLAHRSGLLNVVDNPSAEGPLWNVARWGWATDATAPEATAPPP